MSFCNKTFFLLSVFVYGSEPKITEVVTTSEDSTSQDPLSHNGATPAADPFLVSTTTYNVRRVVVNICIAALMTALCTLPLSINSI